MLMSEDYPEIVVDQERGGVHTNLQDSHIEILEGKWGIGPRFQKLADEIVEHMTSKTVEYKAFHAFLVQLHPVTHAYIIWKVRESRRDLIGLIGSPSSDMSQEDWNLMCERSDENISVAVENGLVQ